MQIDEVSDPVGADASVSGQRAGEDRRYDGGKKITGRKRHIAVDTLGLLLAVFVSVASVDDALGAEFLVDQLEADQQPNLRIVWADSSLTTTPCVLTSTGARTCTGNWRW